MSRKQRPNPSRSKPLRPSDQPLTILETIEQAQREMARERRNGKYNAKPTEVDGQHFDSKREAERYGILKLMSLGGLIHDLRLQVEFPLVVAGQPIGHYIADFTYREEPGNVLVIEDVKGVKTPVYKMKKRLLKALFNIDIRET